MLIQTGEIEGRRALMLLELYHRLPHAAQSLIASAHGYYLQSLRYNAETEQQVEAALARERWTPKEWRAWQQEQLGRLLKHARTTVPFYKAYWDHRVRRGDRSSYEDLKNWPVLEKSMLREKPKAFVSEDCRSKLYLIQTSGTTGTPLQLWQSRETLRQWYAQVEARSRRWYGVSRADRWGILGGKLVAPAKQNAPPFWVWNQGMRQLYLSSYHLSARTIPDYVNAMRSYSVRYLWGYTSSLVTIAREIVEQRLTPPDLRVVITNAEPIYPHQREIIERAFRCPARETYGMAEMAAAAGECSDGSLHVWSDTGIVEVIDHEGEACTAGTVGEFLCTGLINADMPLIRYRIGDRGSFRGEGDCSCGRTFPVLSAIEGRMDDAIITPEGRRIGRMDPILKGNIPIRELQFVQDRLDSLRVQYVPSAGFQASDEEALAVRIGTYVGNLRLEMQAVGAIPRGANGKFRLVVNNVPRDRVAEALSRGAGA